MPIPANPEPRLLRAFIRLPIQKNARLTPIRREEMAVLVIAGRLSKARAARD